MGYLVRGYFFIFLYYVHGMTINDVLEIGGNMSAQTKIMIRIVFVVILFSSTTASYAMTLCSRPEYLVTRTDDPAGGVCEIGDCSLRQAVTASNVCSGAQTIRIPMGTYRLSIAGRDEEANAQGDLDITDSTMIVGTGMPIIDGGGLDRVLHVHESNTAVLFGFVIQNGRSTSLVSEEIESGGDAAGSGGGIRNDGMMHMFFIVVRNNSTAPAGWGGGIFNNGLLMRITHSIIEGNNTSVGGGIFNRGRYFSVTYSTIQGNYSGGLGITGGLHNYFTGIALISESAIINNNTHSVPGTGHGVGNSGQISLRNVTISGNGGRGVESAHGALEIDYSTIVNNAGYGIHGAPASSHISNSILEGNWRNCTGVSTRPTSNGYNISGDATCSFSATGDINNTLADFGPLAYNGGPSKTHALNITSPALDSANPAGCAAVDQRSVPRPQGTACDRGAYEMIPTMPIGSVGSPPSNMEFTRAILIVEKSAECREGPDVKYPVVGVAQFGQEIQVVPQDTTGEWWQAQLGEDKCWISSEAGLSLGNVELFSIKEDERIPTPAPTKTEVIVADPDDDLDGYPASVDCNDKELKINPGAVEIPNDKVDGNCNGEDDK
jgi:hypothetical protein